MSVLLYYGRVQGKICCDASLDFLNMGAVLRGFLLELIFDALMSMKKVFGAFWAPEKKIFKFVDSEKSFF